MKNLLLQSAFLFASVVQSDPAGVETIRMIWGQRGVDDGSGCGCIALRALTTSIERQLASRRIAIPPDALILGTHRDRLLDALHERRLESVAAIDWPAFYSLSPILGVHSLEGLQATVGLALPISIQSGVTQDVMQTIEEHNVPPLRSLLYARLTRSTAGHILFRSQLLKLAEEEFATTPLELTTLLERHTAAAVRAILLARLIKGRPDLQSHERGALVAYATRHIESLLPEEEVATTTLLLLRLAYYLLNVPVIARPALQRLRIVDFRSSRPGMRRRAQPIR